MIRKRSPEAAQFTKAGFAAREVFRHTSTVARKQYPDTLLLLERCGRTQAELRNGDFRQINLYSDWLDGFPDELFTDVSINWHQQQLGEKGLIAAAGLSIEGSALIVTVMQSDLCQQLFRHEALRAACRTQIEKRFGAWYKFLYNAILDFALDCGIAAVYSPTSNWVVKTTRKYVFPGLFRRIYDYPGEFRQARRTTRGRAEYWEVPVAPNMGRLVRLEEGEARVEEVGKLICVFHDTEENLAEEVNPEECRRGLARMLRVEREHGVRTTYNVAGRLFARKRDEIRASDAHCLAFHSYDHVIENQGQLTRCREVDLQTRGYRTPQSIVTPELGDYDLSFYNFEWLASGLLSLVDGGAAIDWEWRPPDTKLLGAKACALQNGIVKIPVLIDDNLIWTGQLSYEQWEERVLEIAEHTTLLTLGLHDCYTRCWLDRYGTLLDRLALRGRFITSDELCDLTVRRLG